MGIIINYYNMKTHQRVSSQRRKSRKAHFTAPSSIRRRMMSCILSKELRTKYDCRSVPVRKGDTVLIKRGSVEDGVRGKSGKVLTVYRKRWCIHVEKVNGIEWATFIFKDNKLEVTAKGSQFNEFKSRFNSDDRGFGYIKIMTGDEMSKRSKFVMVTWVGSNVSVMKKAKMSTDKALMKDIIQNLSVEMQCENVNEITEDRFKTEVIRAGGANYGTGVRDK